MKSSFCLSLASNHLRQSGGFGLYCTVEETTNSLLGLPLAWPSLPPNLQITDFTELRNENEAMDYLKFTQKMIEHFKRERGDAFSVFVLDSLGGEIFSLTSVDEEMRKRMFKFFEFCRSQNLHTFVITERQAGENAELEGTKDS
ncbi:MAG: hypothetical protein Ct9H90mP16_21300 [Candidatus Poseidoniales archaeon]|nr:MAG: hypothetical protein Ct9H90mP16_21300 [Candidatus Poseidoniales archaeon]